MRPTVVPKNIQVDQEYAIVTESLCKTYQKALKPALDHLNLSIKSGEFFGLLGPNGAGKTTALSILCGFQKPDSGMMTVMGFNPQTHIRKIKEIIGLVPQETALYDKLSAHENLAFFGRLCGLGGSLLEKRIHQSLDFTELLEYAQKPVTTFSGGMKRRLNIGIALLDNPKILFLDEPTVGVDTQSRHLIHQRLLELNRSGTTILYTTHYMEEAQELCSRVGVIDNGSLVEQGVPETLLRQHKTHTLEDLFLQLTGKQLRDH